MLPVGLLNSQKGTQITFNSPSEKSEESEIQDPELRKRLEKVNNQHKKATDAIKNAKAELERFTKG